MIHVICSCSSTYLHTYISVIRHRVTLWRTEQKLTTNFWNHKWCVDFWEKVFDFWNHRVSMIHVTSSCSLIGSTCVHLTNTTPCSFNETVRWIYRSVAFVENGNQYQNVAFSLLLHTPRTICNMDLNQLQQSWVLYSLS